jgi:hypothetical protein
VPLLLIVRGHRGFFRVYTLRMHTHRRAALRHCSCVAVCCLQERACGRVLRCAISTCVPALYSVAWSQLISVMSGFHGDSETVAANRDLAVGAGARQSSRSGRTARGMHEYLASSHERAAFERVRRELAVGGVVDSPVYTLVLRQAGNMAWTAIANCTTSVASVDPCVTVSGTSNGPPGTVDASAKLFTIAVPLRTTIFTTISSSSSVLLQMRAAFDAAPSEQGTDDQASSARSNTFRFTNCGYSARMLYIHVASLDASKPLPSFDIGFYTSPVYEDEVRSPLSFALLLSSSRFGCDWRLSEGVDAAVCVCGRVCVVCRAVPCLRMDRRLVGPLLGDVQHWHAATRGGVHDVVRRRRGRCVVRRGHEAADDEGVRHGAVRVEGWRVV